MQWSPEQDAALKAVQTWLRDSGEQIFRLFGYAGTGKTTLARHFAENVDGDVLFAAFTGKAAHVLRSKGCAGAGTIHSLIYRPRGGDEEGPTFAINRDSDAADASLIIIDECSMVDEELGRDLLSFGTPILVLGDPAQLPPVKGGGFFTDSEPDIMLTEVHRQASDNPIIAMSMTIREGGFLEHGVYGDSQVVTRGDIDSDDILEADQVLIGMNRTRRLFNKRIRTLKEFIADTPMAGDKLVCLRNERAKGLLNGGLWTVRRAHAMKRGRIKLEISPEDDETRRMVNVSVMPEMFDGRDEDIPYAKRRNADDFDYGYALTVHKSQGSQWNNVVLFDESGAFREHAQRWLYTAITRAAERITIVK